MKTGNKLDPVSREAFTKVGCVGSRNSNHQISMSQNRLIKPELESLQVKECLCYEIRFCFTEVQVIGMFNIAFPEYLHPVLQIRMADQVTTMKSLEKNRIGVGA